MVDSDAQAGLSHQDLSLRVFNRLSSLKVSRHQCKYNQNAVDMHSVPSQNWHLTFLVCCDCIKQHIHYSVHSG